MAEQPAAVVVERPAVAVAVVHVTVDDVDESVPAVEAVAAGFDQVQVEPRNYPDYPDYIDQPQLAHGHRNPTAGSPPYNIPAEVFVVVAEGKEWLVFGSQDQDLYTHYH